MENFSANKISEISLLEATSHTSPSSTSLDYRHERLSFAPCSTSNPCLSAETGLFSNGSNLVHSEGQSLREFDEKLQSLQKENFNLKLRIFFLEERKEALGQNGVGTNGSSATHAKCTEDDISKYNIDLKIENEDLRIELQKKQELLCQAAKAIELMEDSQRKQVDSSSATIKELAEQIECLQSEISTLKHSSVISSVHIANEPMATDLRQINLHEDGMNDCATFSQDMETLQSQIHAQKRTIADKLCMIQDLEEKLTAKTKAHDNGCKTIHHLLIKIRDLDDEISRLKVETKTDATDGTQLKPRTDECVKEEQWREELTEVCNLLACRLKELAGFLDSLLKHDEVLNVLSKNHHEEMRRAVDNSLDLSRNISLCNEGLISFSQNCSTSLNDSLFSKLINDTNGQGIKDLRNELLEPSLLAIAKLSLNKCDTKNRNNDDSLLMNAEQMHYELENLREINATLQSTIQKLTDNEHLLAMKCNDQNRMLTKQIMFNKELTSKLDRLHKQHESSKIQHSKQINQLLVERAAHLEHIRDDIFQQFDDEIKKRIDEQRIILLHELHYETEELKKCIEDKESQLYTLNANMDQLQVQMLDKDKTIHNLKRNLDEATLQTSKAVLERTKYMNERDSLEKTSIALKEKYDQILAESSELHTKLAKLGHKNAQLHNKLVFIETKIPMCHENDQTSLYTMLSTHTSSNTSNEQQMHGNDDDDANNYTAENDLQHFSMEYAIEACDSDTSSDSNPPSSSKSSKNDSVGDVNDIGLPMASTANLWNTQSMNQPHDCEKIEQENIDLKRKLEKTRKAFEKTWAHLRISNQRKEQIEKDIRNEIYKTHSVLKSVRSNMENASSNKK